MSIYEYDEEKNYKMLQEQYWNMGHERGKSEGIAQGRTEGKNEGKTRAFIQLILAKMQKNYTPEQIADILEMDPNFVKEICQIALPMSPNYDQDKIYETYHTMKQAYCNLNHHPELLLYWLFYDNKRSQNVTDESL